MEKKIKVNIRSGVGQNHDNEPQLNITIIDTTSRTSFLELSIPLDRIGEIVAGINRGGYNANYEAKLSNVDNIGKTKEADVLVFPIHESVPRMDEKKWAEENANLFCKKGWKALLYFDSKDSFYEKDGVRFARTTQVRYVAKEDE